MDLLFRMTNRVMLNNADHQDLRVAIRHGADFGDSVNQVLVFPTEFEQVQREYPIVFRKTDGGDFYAVALLGLDRDENLFLDERGWQARYIPAIQQRGPFASEADDEISIDLDDPRVGTEEGQPLYLTYGGNAPYLQHVVTVLGAVRHGAQAMAPLFAMLHEYELIQPVAIDIALDSGDSYRVPDIFSVAQDRLGALDGEPLERLHKSGVLRAATMAVASLDNVNRLIELKTAKLVGR
jgi:hypothetical protein